MAVVMSSQHFYKIQEMHEKPTIRVMTDGYPYQLSQRSVVGTGAAKTEVKDAEDHYAWRTVNIEADVEPAVMALAGLEGDAASRH